MSSVPPEPTLSTPQDLRVTTLLTLLKSKYKKSLVSHVLNRRSELSSDVQSALNSAINREVKVHGFPNYPERALPPVLKPTILSTLRTSDSLANAVLRAWFTSQPSLRDIVEEHLRDGNWELEQLDFDQHKLNDYWSSEDWNAERDKIMKSHDSLNSDDVALMLCCLTGKMPSAVAESLGGEERILDQNILDRTIGYLKQLPADSSVWEAVPDFLSSVSDISESKAAEREANAAASREIWAQTISKFINQYSEQLEYLELDVSGWSNPRDTDASVLAMAQDLIRDIGELIDDHDSTPQQGLSFRETTRLFTARREIVERVRDAASTLENLLIDGKDPDDTPEPPDSRGQTLDDTDSKPESSENETPEMTQTQVDVASTDASLSDIRVSDGVLNFDPNAFNYRIALPISADSLTITPLASHSKATIKVSTENGNDGLANLLKSDTGGYCIESIPIGLSNIAVAVIAEDGETTLTYILAVSRSPSSDATLVRLASTDHELEFDPALTEYSIRLDEENEDLSITFETSHETAVVPSDSCATG